MATELSHVEYIVDQIQGAGVISYRKMFGEYAIYCDTKVVALVCDNQLFVKPTIAGRVFAEDLSLAPPYPGAKPYLFIDDNLDNSHWLTELISLTAKELPFPKPKSPNVR